MLFLRINTKHMATHRISLTNAKGGLRTMTEQAWKNIPKDKQGTYNGWYPYEGQLSPAQPKSKNQAQSPVKQPPFIPKEVIDMREAKAAELAAKDKEIEALKAQLAAQSSVTSVDANQEEPKPMKEIDFDINPVTKIDPAGNPAPKSSQPKNK